jgi:hypothetical protein
MPGALLISGLMTMAVRVDRAGAGALQIDRVGADAVDGDDFECRIDDLVAGAVRAPVTIAIRQS